MGVFDNILGGNESLFLDELPLDPEYMPSVIKYRENEIQQIANCMKPLLNNRNGRNIVISGMPGIGKTVSVRHLLNELNKESNDVFTLFINCWKKDTPYKIVLDICEQVGYKFVVNRKTDELLNEIRKILNKKSSVIILDECDKLQDMGILYTLLEDINKRSMVLITNETSWLSDLDKRIRSRLMAESLNFRNYSSEEVYGILKQRLGFAFAPNVFDDDGFEIIARKTYDAGDIRSGLFLLKEAGLNAESRASRKINVEDVMVAVGKLNEFTIKSTDVLNDEEKEILEIVKNNSGKAIGEIHRLYGKLSYRSFYRKVKKFEGEKRLRTKEMVLKSGGRSTVVFYGTEKRLDEF